MLCIAINDTGEADRVIGCLVLDIGGSRPHASEGWARTEFDQMLKFVASEEQALRFNPAHGRSELVCREVDEDGVGNLLAQQWVACSQFLRILLRLGDVVVNHLRIFFGDLECAWQSRWECTSQQGGWG